MSGHLRPCRQSPSPRPSVADTIARITSQLQYQHSTWGFSVIELTTGEVLLEQSSDKLFMLTTHQFIQFAIILFSFVLWVTNEYTY
jgi:hypothetical protein